MRRAGVTMVLLTAFGGVAHATEPGVRTGLSLAAVRPLGHVHLSVSAPPVATLPVRLAFAESGATEAAIVVDVGIAVSRAVAHATLEDWRARLAVEPVPVANLGDEAFGSDGHVALRRANVFFSVRRVGGNGSVVEIARALVRAVDAAPIGRPFARPIVIQRPADLPLGVAVAIGLFGDVLDAWVTAEGPAVVRRTGQGWVVARTGAGSVRIHGVAVDSLLRASDVVSAP